VIKALIIDDELSAIHTLQLMVERYVPEISAVETAIGSYDGMNKIALIKPDILFLDVQMPVMTGFELLKKTGAGDMSVIFTTAYDKYAIEAIRFSALDYLLKPIDADELRQAIDRYKIHCKQRDGQQGLYNNLLHNISAGSQQEFKLALPTLEGTYFFSPHEIIRLEGESNYTWFHFAKQKPLLISRTLKEYEEILSGHGFIRVHKSHIVNKEHVISSHAQGVLVMLDQSRVEVSRRRREEVMEALKGG